VGSNDGILYVFVSNEDCAAEIETNHSDDLAAAAEQVFSQPIRIVNADGLFQPSKKRHLYRLHNGVNRVYSNKVRRLPGQAVFLH
jgi:hemin uptake protein HemP